MSYYGGAPNSGWIPPNIPPPSDNITTGPPPQMPPPPGYFPVMQAAFYPTPVQGYSQGVTSYDYGVQPGYNMVSAPYTMMPPQSQSQFQSSDQVTYSGASLPAPTINSVSTVYIYTTFEHYKAFL